MAENMSGTWFRAIFDFYKYLAKKYFGQDKKAMYN
jgi:hypothetical protein